MVIEGEQWVSSLIKLIDSDPKYLFRVRVDYFFLKNPSNEPIAKIILIKDGQLVSFDAEINRL